jgi:hypothetical protein
MNVKMLENIYETISKFRMMYGIELWGVYDALKETDRIHGRFVRKYWEYHDVLQMEQQKSN